MKHRFAASSVFGDQGDDPAHVERPAAQVAPLAADAVGIAGQRIRCAGWMH